MMLSGVFSLIGIEDGIGYEEIYCLTSGSTPPSTPSSSNANGAVPSGWSATPQTVSRSYPYQWVSKRSKVDGTWGAWSTPVEYNRFVEDAIIYESCYKATQYNSTPSTPTSSNVDGSVPSGWYSTPPDISAVNAYVWESQRKKSKGSWGSWSTPKLKNRWANDGAQGGKGAKMRMREWSSGTEYLQGKDGEDFYDIVLYNSKLYLCLKSHTASSSNNPVTSINNYLGYWEIAQEWTFVATKLLLTEKIVASQIDANGIVAENVDLSGKITATSGKIGGWSISGNNLVCSGFDTKILVEASGTRFMRINAEESIMCYIRSDESTGVSIAVYGDTNSAIGLNVLCNSMGKGYAIYSRGNVMLNAREGERVELYGLTVNVRKVSSSSNFALQTNDDFIEFNNASAMSFNMSSNSKKGKLIFMKKISVGNDVTLTGGFRNSDGVGVSTTLTIGDEKSRIFVHDGTYWVQFYCG